MANHSNNSGETSRVVIVLAMATIVGVLIVVQLIRAKPIDFFGSLVISVCFVIAVVATAMWGSSSKS
jgi:hypothetical protein